MIDLLFGGPIGADGTLVFTSSEATVALAAVLAVLAWGMAFRGARSFAAKATELTLWGFACALAVLVVAGPVWRVDTTRREPGRVAVLVDGSASMAVLEDGVPRSSGLADVVAELRAQVPRSEVFTFGAGVTAGMPDSFEGPETDLDASLEALRERLTGERLAGIVVVTDGLDRGVIRRSMSGDGPPQLPELQGPLTVVQVGDATELRDLAVRSVDTGGYAFLRNPFTLTADVQGTGFEGRTVDVSLLQDGSLVLQKPVTLDATGLATVSFDITPSRAGRFAYEVVVPNFENDAVPANNRLPVVVRVVRDKMRILQVAGSPSWDVKFLRRFLKGDPSVDLVSFFILRTIRDMDDRYSDDELSLIAFPYMDLFSTDLWSFDVVIFQNFNYEPFFQARGRTLLANLEKYVEEDGGAVVMLGGDRSFGLGRYENTPLANVLPVEIDNAERPSIDAFQPVLTDAGARHPVTRLATDPTENQAWWKRLHAMDGTNIVPGPTKDATVLLQHPTLRTENGRPLPTLTVREAGAGRTMALTVDSSWRWSMSEAAEGRGNQAYLRFWKNSLRWLMRDSSVSRVTVDASRENYAIGDEVRLVVRARDLGFAALPGAAATVVIERDGKESERTVTTDESGEAVVMIPALQRGTHRVRVSVVDGSTKVGAADTVYAVTARDPELDEVAPDGVFLEAWARSMGGTFFRSTALGQVQIDEAAGRDVRDRREVDVWRSPFLLGWLSIFAGFAWWVRRRAGLA